MVHMVQTRIAPGVTPLVITPELHTTDNDTDQEHATDSTNVFPRDWFHVNDTETRLDSKIANKLDWEIQTTRSNVVTLAPLTQTITVDGVTHDITSRALTCRTHTENIGSEH